MNVIADSMAVITPWCQAGVLGGGEVYATLELRIEEDGCATLSAEEQRRDQLDTVSEAQGLTLTAGTQLRRDEAVIADPDKIADLAKLFEPLVARVLLGRDRYWNGSNWIGCLDEDASAAWMEIEALFEGLETERWTTDMVVWDAAEFVYHGHDVTSETTDAQLTKFAAAYVADAEREKIHLHYGSRGDGVQAMYEVLFEIREELIPAKSRENDQAA